MKPPRSILIVQTAFLGDVVLTLPLVQVLHRQLPDAAIDFLTTPRAAELLRNHPAIRSVITFDKRNTQRGLSGILTVAGMLRKNHYDVALVPHRSLRSASLVLLSRIPVRAGFDTSSGSFLFTDRIPYRSDRHEIERDLSFLGLLGLAQTERELPSLYPSRDDADAVDRVLSEFGIAANEKPVAIAPGSVWMTKRWPEQRYGDCAGILLKKGYRIVLVGGNEDKALCERIRDAAGGGSFVAAGKLSILQSAELLRRCRCLVTNDSAPLHLAVAMRTPVVAIFGATVPEFGFAPYGARDVVCETKGLTCRPCSIHGGNACPIGTFVCMINIAPDVVAEKVAALA